MILGAFGAGSSMLALLRGARVSQQMVDAAAAVGHHEALAQFTADMRAASLPSLIGHAAMALALVWIGWGQRRYRRWAVAASQRWGAIAALLLLANVPTTMFVVVPIHDRFVAAVGAQAYPYHFPYFVLVGTIIVQGAFVVWTVRTFRKPEVVAAMDQPPLPPTLPPAKLV
jgi:hypothetical protein